MKKHQNNTSLSLQLLFYFTSSPYGVSSPKSYPLWDGPILLHFLAQNSLYFKTFVGRLVREIHNSTFVHCQKHSPKLQLSLAILWQSSVNLTKYTASDQQVIRKIIL